MKHNNNEEIELTFELSSFKKEEIKVAIKNKHLFIKAKKEHKNKSHNHEFEHKEESKHNFESTSTLPPVDAKKMRWHFKGGTLTVKIPKL